MIIIVPRWALPEQERFQVLVDDDQPHAVLVREGTTLGNDLAKPVNDIVQHQIALASLDCAMRTDPPGRD